MSESSPLIDRDWSEVYAQQRRGARIDRLRQLIFEVRQPDKPQGYDAQRAAEELADLIEDGVLR